MLRGLEDAYYSDALAAEQTNTSPSTNRGRTSAGAAAQPSNNRLSARGGGPSTGSPSQTTVPGLPVTGNGAPIWRDVSSRLFRGAGGSLPLSDWTSSFSLPWRCSASGPPAICATRSLTLCTNGSLMLPTLARCVERSTDLLRAHAYVHWYERFGINEEHIGVAVESVASVVGAYQHALGRAHGT